MSLVVSDLHFHHDGALKSDVEYFEASGGKLRVRWAVESQPEGFFPVGNGVAYVLDAANVGRIPPSWDMDVPKSREGRYFWEEGNTSGEPASLLMILIFPRHYTIANPVPRPVGAKDFYGRLALRWVLSPDSNRQAKVTWNMVPFSGQLSSEIDRIHGETMDSEPALTVGFDVDVNQISILFLAADPTDRVRLRLGQEFREIQLKLQLAKMRELFRLEQRLSVRAEDLSQSFLDVKPQIVHFSGHGTDIGEICVEDSVGRTNPIPPEVLADLFNQFKQHINCVVLNACFSEPQAKAIVQHIDYVVGMRKEIDDRAAIAFAIGFYQGLGAGRTIEDAYELGKVQIGLQRIPGQLTPVLLKKA